MDSENQYMDKLKNTKVIILIIIALGFLVMGTVVLLVVNHRIKNVKEPVKVQARNVPSASEVVTKFGFTQPQVKFTEKDDAVLGKTRTWTLDKKKLSIDDVGVHYSNPVAKAGKSPNVDKALAVAFDFLAKNNLNSKDLNFNNQAKYFVIQPPNLVKSRLAEGSDLIEIILYKKNGQVGAYFLITGDYDVWSMHYYY